MVGPTAADSSGNGVDGTYIGSITYGEPGAIVGDPDTSIFLNATNYINAGTMFGLAPAGAFSLEAWVMRPIDGQYHTIGTCTDMRSLQPASGYDIVIDPMGAAPLSFARLSDETDATAADDADSLGVTWTSGWHHVVVTYDTQTMTVFVDGAPVDPRPRH